MGVYIGEEYNCFCSDMICDDYCCVLKESLAGHGGLFQLYGRVAVVAWRPPARGVRFVHLGGARPTRKFDVFCVFFLSSERKPGRPWLALSIIWESGGCGLAATGHGGTICAFRGCKANSKV